MKAVVYERHGSPDVLRLQEVPEPAPRSGTARVAVHAAGLNPKDVLLRKGRMRWLGGRLPRTPGYDVAGTLLDPVDGWPVGTRVFGMIQDNQGGACAEVARLRHTELARCPDALGFEDAAGLPLAGLTALQALRDELRVQPGQTVLINGASGGVGTLAVQIGVALGVRVIGVCSGRNAEHVLALGAERVVDYTTDDVLQERVDHVFDVFGSLPWPRSRTMARSRTCTTIPRPGSIARGLLARAGLHRASLVVVRSQRADLEQLARWVDDGRLKPVTDRVVPFTDSAAGHHHLETRRARGKVVVRVR